MPPLHQGDFNPRVWYILSSLPGGKLASNGDAGGCVDGLCEVCELGSNRGCGGDDARFVWLEPMETRASVTIGLTEREYRRVSL